MRGPRLYTGLSVTVGVEQSWHVQELWLGTGWDTHTWVCSQAVLGGRHYSAPFSITSALAGETKIRPGRFVSQTHLPSFSSLFRFGVGAPSDDQAVACGSSGKNMSSWSLRSLPITHERPGGQVTGCREVGGTEGRFWRFRQQGGVRKGCTVAPEEGQSPRTEERK